MIANDAIEWPPDPWSRLQLRIAQRADQIARDRKIAATLSLHCWLLAEGEVMRELNDQNDLIGSSSGPIRAVQNVGRSAVLAH